MKKMTCSAVGDMLLQFMLPLGNEEGYEGFAPVRDFIRQADFCFGNLETTVHNYECPPAHIGGGGYLCAEPRTLDVLKAYGLNILSTANNHALDFTQEGTVRTVEHLDAAGFAHSGSGKNLYEASKPAYLDTPSGRYALISCGTMYRENEMAGEQTKNLLGRPGINGLRYEEKYFIRKEQMDVLKQIAKETYINGAKDISRAEGFSPALKEGEFWFGGISFYEAEEPGRVTKINPRDLKRVTDMIEEAGYYADHVVVSFHSHDLELGKKEAPDMYLKEFARACIDAGAHAVIGHGPHLLRPVEIYKGCPIFYSLGNFILMNHLSMRVPHQQYEKYACSPMENMKTVMYAVSANETRGLRGEHRMMESVIPYWEMEDGKLTKLILMPVELGYGQKSYECGWPVFRPDLDIIQNLAEMSEEYGTKIIVREDGIGEVVLP